MDRKGWIIITICSILLVLNYAWMPKTPPPTQNQDKPESSEQADQGKAASPDTGETGEAPTNTAGLKREPFVEEVGEQIKYLTSQKNGKDEVKFTLTSRGGGIKSVELLNQMAVGSKTEHIILNADAPAAIGAIGEGVDEFLALHYDLKDNKAEPNTIYCEARTPAGLKITKRWRLVEDATQAGAPWSLELKITFSNESKGTVNLAHYSFFNGAATPLYQREWENQGGAFYLDDGSFENTDSNWFKKGFFSKAKPQLKESVSELQYAGVSNQFFTTIVRPKQAYPSTFWAKTSKVNLPGSDPDSPKYAIRSGFSLPEEKLSPKDTTTYSYSVYIGPKHYSELKQMDGDVKEVMNYGWFWFVSVPLNNVLNWLHDVAFVHLADKWSWGLAIIALTILIRIVIWPLHNKSTRTMKRMSKLQPLMKDLREKYKDDPNKLNQETMKLYKEYQINPMGGCLPMFLQIPIFFGYYKMLQFAVELRGGEFLWVKDLSMPDTIYELPFGLPFLGDSIPINLLPILMAVTMVIQMSMTPKTGDKMQQRMMMFMPFMFFFFCYNFASALALYWTTQNIFSIGQTWLTNRLPEPELQKRAPSGKPGKKTFMERMAARVEEQQRIQQAAKSGKQPMRDATPDNKKPGKKRNPKTGG
ncbi:membrane protein insertase YidC [Verrucomicrobiaceae bacterium N1E253]|uniref:Membrane protein insertase YidC n=1 Tax=Oceaniferula marina TaxID=2748318 RepID=A0A851GDB6_9BACT|nr:membrane protein insertase YidC [Oceaniferula marina]NWK54932.1 membrane protein insertase YidC [Oceaniferula marina]